MRIVITGGKTMGHIKPAMVLADDLAKKHEIFYFGNDASKEYKEALQRDYMTFYKMKVIGFNRKRILVNLKAIYLLIKEYFHCKKIIKKLNPDVIIGFGGFVSAPVLLAGIRLRKKTFIHEQNSIPGLVNKTLGNRVSKVLVSFEYTLKYFDNGILCGNPVGQAIKYQKSNLIYQNQKKLLFIGGSQGAKRINELALELKDDYQIILICGDRFYTDSLPKGITVLKYYDNLPSLMIEADLVISRSGASTIAEILAIGKPVIFIPSPNVSNNHQEINSNILYDKGACEMILEADCNKESLVKKINRLLENPFLCEDMILRQREMNIDNSLARIKREIL